MLSLKINNDFLELNPNTVITFDKEGALFADSVFSSAYSFPIEIPLTPTNKRVLGFHEILENEITTLSYPCFLFSNAMEIVKGTFTIQRVTSTKISGFIVENCVAVDMLETRIRELDFGGVRMLGTDISTHATAVAGGNVDTYDYTFFPVYNENFYAGKNDIGPMPHAYSKVMNAWDYNHGCFWLPVHVDRIVNDGAAPYYQDMETPPSYSCYVPFPYLKYVVSQIAKSLGLVLSGSFFEDRDIKKLVIFNTVSLDNSVVYNTPPDNFISQPDRINVANHLPDIKIGEFLKALKEMFQLSLQIKGTLLLIDTKDSRIKDGAQLDFTDKTSPIFSINIDDAQKKREGYTLILSNDSDDEWAEKYSNKITSEDIQKDDAAISVTSPIVSDEPGIIRYSPNIFRDVEKGSYANPRLTPAAKMKINDGKQNIEIACGTLDTYAFHLIDYADPTVSGPSTPPTIQWSYGNIPTCKMIGNSPNWQVGTGNNFAFRLLFYFGYSSGPGSPLPVGSNSVWDYNGNQVLNTSLKWLGGDFSLYKKFWEKYLKLLPGKKVEFNVKLTEIEYLNLDTTQKIRVKNRVYYIQKVSFPLNNSGIGIAKFMLIQSVL